MAEGNSIENVEYRDIPGMPYYKAGSNGVILTLTVPYKKTIGNVWREARQVIRGCGYPTIFVKGKPYMVHHLVMLAFVGPRPEGMECCHNDGNPANNKLSNLRWDTHKANVEDSIKHNTHNQGVRNGRAKLTVNEIKEIRKKHSQKVPLKSLSVRYGVHVQTIYRIISKELWKHV